MTRTKAFAALLAVALTGCGPESEILSEGEYLYFEPVGIGQTGATRDTTEWVVRDSVAWIEAGERLSPLAPFKPVDFSQEVAVAIAIPTESGGYHVEVESIEEMPDEVLVTYLFHEPARDCITLAALALPFQVVSVRRFDQENVRFVRRTQKYECTWKQPN